MELLIDILKIIGGLLSIAIAISIVGKLFSSIGSPTPLSDYDLYGEEGADGYEQRMMGLTDEEYAEYQERGFVFKVRIKNEKDR